ncbi:putative ABC transport system permease protein [Cribrihabitans marinus]|uniref:Putative ABC transport system permease protein n=1 Tax=Cribrihabitans marinus TaxID=1227549 RepID=A0A1H6WRL6_9RHOB|nr:FtsX-like permease family protein [Cribrihabitans marinus]GGH24109.1 ABC transporter permease [Cribrihabitans marinus]SEJ15480.1 putative ABC transport system permease protein [Cribrihabitans marinus]
MIGAACLALWSHWRRHKLQLATLLAGLALATGLWSAVQAINGEARASYDRAAAQLGAGQWPELRPRAGADIPLETYVSLRRTGWRLAPVLEGNLRLAGRSVTVMGVGLLTHPALPAVEAAEGGDGLAPVEVLTPPGRLFADPGLAARLEGNTDLPPVLPSDAVPPGTLLTDIAVAERLLDRPGTLSRLLILEPPPPGLPPLSELAPDLDRVAARGSGDIARLTDSFHLNLTAFGLLSFAVGMFIVHGTVGLSFEQRRGMIRSLRAMGLPLGLLARLMLAELALLALLGGGAGLILGYAVAGALLPDVASSLRGLYGAPVEGTLSLRPGWVLSGLGMALAGTGLASARALWRVAHLPLLAAPGMRAWGGSAAAMRAMVAAGVALILAGALATWLPGGLLGGFLLLGGVLTGAALLLPPLLSVILAMGARMARGPLAQWVWADMRAQLPGLSLALMALLLALAANIGVGTMVSSFRLTFTGWLDQRLASELYVAARDDAQGARMATWLGDRADAVLPSRSVERRHNGAPIFVYGIVDDPTYRDNWPLIAESPGVWDALARGEAVLINEQMARRDDLWPGDTVSVLPDWPLRVAGVYSDYGNPTAQAITALPALLERVPNLPNQRFGIRIAPDQVDDLARDLRADFDLPPGALVDQAALKAQSMAVFDKTFLVTGALNVLTLGVAAFAMLTSLLTLWTQRLPQVAPLWAMGLTRARLARLELLRSLALAALTALAALPLGLVLAWALLAVVNVEAFGWRLPMFLFPLDWLRLFALALLAAGLAALWPARRLSRLPPAGLLKVFSNER